MQLVKDAQSTKNQKIPSSGRENRTNKVQPEQVQKNFSENPFRKLKDDKNVPYQRDQVLPSFVNNSNHETVRNRNDKVIFAQQQNNNEGADEEDEAMLARNNNQFNLIDYPGAGQANFNEPGSPFGTSQKMTLNQIQNKWDDASKKTDNIQVQEQQNIKCSIEIKNGIPQRSLNNFHKNQNALVLNNYTGVWGLFIFLYETIFIFDHFVLVIHFCALAISAQGDTTAYSHVACITVASILVTGFLNFLHDRKLKQAAEKVNQKPVEKFIFSKRHKSFQISDWGSIQTGDIIKIKANQEIPCDALILNIVGSKFEHQTCYQRGSLWDDAKHPTLKRSYQGTMNKTGSYISDSKFADQISGLLKWEYNHRGYFTGDFKQIDNPAAFEIQPHNVVQRGCYASHCQFMVCLALNVGISSMGNGFRSPEQLQARLKRSLMQKKVLLRPEGVQFRALRSFQIFSIIFCLLPCVLVLFEDFALKNTSLGKFASMYINIQPSSNLDKVRIMFDVMSGFMMNLPYLSHICMEAVVYFHAYFVLWDINLVPANIMFTNLRTMKTLGQVDTIICSKAALLNLNLRYVAAFKISDIICFNQAEQKRQQIGANAINEVESENSSEFSDEEDLETLEYLPNQTQFINGFQSTVANQLMDQSHPKHEDFKEFLLALTLCHHATTQKNHQVQHQMPSLTYKSLYKEEESQLQFACLYGFQFKSRNNRMLTIINQGSLQRFEEIMIRKIQYQDEWVTVQVIKPFQTFQSGAKIYYKGNLRIIQHLLRRDASKNFESEIDRFSKEGIHAIGIAKRDMEIDEAVELGRVLQDNSSKKGTEYNNDAFFIQLAQNLDLVGVLGMKNATNTRDSLLMEEMRKNGVKLVLLSTDSTAETITDLNALKMFHQYRKPINIIGRTDRQVEESLKSSLKQLVEKRVNDTQSNDQNAGDLSSNISRVTSNTPKISKKAKLTSTSFSSTTSLKTNNQSSLADFFDQDQKNSVFVNGESLQFILKDETLTKLFLTLCSLCTLVVGSSVTPYQKRDLTAAIRQFSIQGKQGYVVSVVAQQADKFISLESDITVGIQKSYQQSDLLACSDVQIRDIYGITYLLFKHGTILHRRLRVVLNEFIYRTVLLQTIQLFFFVTSGFTTVLPYNTLFFATHVALISPVLYFTEGITHMDYGYGIFHRIFGEYKFNKTHNLSIFDFTPVILSSLFDSLLLCLFYGVWTTSLANDLHATYDGKPLTWQTKTVINSTILALMQYWRNRTTLCVTKIFGLFNFLLLLFSMAIVFEDEYLAGILSVIQSPYSLAFLLFILLVLNLKQYIMHFYQFWTTKNKLLVERYQNIEDRLYMEEYEDPEQTFEISDSVAFESLVKQVEDTKLFSINQNLLKVHRSDSIDQILDRINVSGGQSAEGRSNFTNRSMINKFNLKLNDINKEIEYNEVSISDSLVKNCVILIWTSVLLYALLGLFKIFNQILENNESTTSRETSTLEKSDTVGNLIGTIYIEVFEVLVSLSAIYMIKKVKSIRSDLVVFGLVVIFNVMVNVNFYIDPENPLIQIQFLYTIAFSHLIRLNSVFFVSLVCLASAIGFLNIRLATIQAISDNKDIHSKDSSIQLIWQALAVTLYIFFWTYYTYWDEVKQKVRFVTQFRHIKELQKLKSIINILIPSIVRSKIQDGKKNFSDSQGEVTVVFVDIDGFDQLVQQYTGRELIELLDRVYNTFDSLSEQHGLQKIETVGKTYMACSGLKVVEKDIDNRLLGSHHSVRVTDFACNVQSYVSTQTLRNSKKLCVKIGIHTGEVIAGVVGETKPQFSLIGPTINKTSRVCSKCPLNKILISKETHQNLQASASNFTFGAMKVEMKGIGQEEVYTVQKRRIQQSKLIGKKSQIEHRKQKKKSEDAGQRQTDKNLNNKNGVKDGRDIRAQDNQNDQDEDPSGGQNIETSRTINENPSSDRNSNSSIQNENETDRQQKSNRDDSYEDDVAGNILKSNELKDDKQIVKSAALNERYNLVERPRFLTSFELKDQEQVFLHSLLKQNYSLEVFQLVSKSIIDLIIIECLVYSYFGSESYYIYISVFCAEAIVNGGLLYFMRRLTTNGIMIFLVIQIIGIAVSMIFFILNGPKFTNFLLRSSQQMTLGIYQAIIVISKAIPFRIFASVQIILFLALITQNYFFIDLGVLNVQTYTIDSILQLVLFALLILASHSREMKVRRQYNQQRIIEVEIEKTQELLEKLVPQHVLQGILNDQRVVDSLENVTLLYTDMVGFTEFSRTNKPQEVVNLLSRLFSKFDQLCEQIGVYKVHTIGDCYVVMSYTGKIAKERRSTVIQIEEAFKVIKVGLEMINIITEERTKSKNPALKNLDMRVGIHSGKIVGGIIGTKVVRYDIFGQDVLIANKMESNGLAGAVCISEQTYKLIQKNKFVSDTFDFTEHQSCSIGTIGKTIKSYIVQQIFYDVRGESNQALSEEDEGEADDRSSRSSNTSYGEQNESSDQSDQEGRQGNSNDNEDSQQSYEE